MNEEYIKKAVMLLHNVAEENAMDHFNEYRKEYSPEELIKTAIELERNALLFGIKDTLHDIKVAMG